MGKTLRDRCEEALAELARINRTMEQGVHNGAHVKRWKAQLDYLADFVFVETGRRQADAASQAATSTAEECARIAESHSLGTQRSDPNAMRDDVIYDAACRDIAKAIRDAAPSTAPQTAWLPIETAPKDDLIDIWIGGTSQIRWSDCYYDRICDEWRTSRPSGRLMVIKASHVTHWMPAPTAPLTRPEREANQP